MTGNAAFVAVALLALLLLGLSVACFRPLEEPLVTEAEVRSINEKYGALMSEEHFHEIRERAPAYRAGALTGGGGPITGPDDPRVLLTSAGLAVIFTADAAESPVVHHFSLSAGGTYLASAAAAQLGYTLLTALGYDPGRALVAHSDEGVWHMVLPLSASEHQRIISGPVEVPGGPYGIELRRRGLAWRDELTQSGRLFRDLLELDRALLGVQPRP